MPYTVKFLDNKLYQSLSFDADIKFQQCTDYAKKIWVLKEYKAQGGEVQLTEAMEGDGKEDTSLQRSSFSLRKSFKNDELVVEVIQHYTFQDNFNFFVKAELDEDTGDKELDRQLAEIKESDFSEQLIKNLIKEGSPDCNFESK